MKRINTNDIVNWKTATKTRPIKAKHINDVFSDKTVICKFLLNTLEGDEPIGFDVFVCRGEQGDVWQQKSKRLLEKYTVIKTDENGWLICEPKPDNEVDCVEVNKEFSLKDTYKFSIVGHFGQTVEGEANVQMGVEGDFICRNKTDKTDVWIVKRNLFLNTYNLI